MLEVDQRLHQVGVELEARAEFAARLPRRTGGAIGAIGGHGVVGVGHRNQPADRGQLAGRDPIGIAPAIHALVVVPNGVENLRADDALQPAYSHLRVAAHEPRLREVERSRLGDDPLRDPELSDVVEKAREA